MATQQARRLKETYMAPFEKDKAYMEVLGKFRSMIDTEYRNGGWLPPVREMSERLNVCMVTYRKATARLAAEGMAESYPRKGIYIIPQKHRKRKIGLVVGTGEDSPLFYANRVVRDILQDLDERDFFCQLIQGNSPLNIARSAVTHCVDGVIWLLPRKPDFAAIREIHGKKISPLICVGFYTPSSEDDAYLDEIPTVMEDYGEMSKKLIEPFWRTGHKTLACVGQTLWRAEYTGLCSLLREKGVAIDDEFCIGNAFHNPGKAASLVTEKGVTGLIVNGTARHISMVFEELSALPKEKQPAVLVWKCDGLTEICTQFPEINLIAVANHDQKKYGATAVDTLLENLETPDLIRSTKVASFTVDHLWQKED
jgi:DNA-binding LacI/PurR family transcriptional regulator